MLTLTETRERSGALWPQVPRGLVLWAESNYVHLVHTELLRFPLNHFFSQRDHYKAFDTKTTSVSKVH